MDEYDDLDMAQLKAEVSGLVGLMGVMMHDLAESGLEIVKWRQTLIKYLPRRTGQMLELDILDLLHLGRYVGYEGYQAFLGHGGWDPSSSSEFMCRMHRMVRGIEDGSEWYTYSISLKGGYKMYCEAVGCIRGYLGGAVKDVVMEGLEPLWKELDGIVKAFDTENHALHDANEKYNKALNEAEAAIRNLRDEVRLLYGLLYANKIQIPLDGHFVSLEPFACPEDPNSEDYDSDYSLPDRYFDFYE